jgi:hypothetical protein
MIESLGGEVRRNARGAIERKAHRDADPVDAVDLRVSVLERHQVDVASAEKFEWAHTIGELELPLQPGEQRNCLRIARQYHFLPSQVAQRP